VRLRKRDLWELEAMGFGSEREKGTRVNENENEKMRERKRKRELKDVTVELPYHP